MKTKSCQCDLCKIARCIERNKKNITKPVMKIINDLWIIGEIAVTELEMAKHEGERLKTWKKLEK